jgi:HEPN domain
MRWQQGRAEVDKMLADGELQRVQASREHADRLLNQARRHLDSAEATCESDPEGAYGTLYDAGRKALWAILANQGLRPTTKGGHLAVYQAVKAQLDPPMGQQLRPFDRMRRQRHDAEYQQIDTTELDPDDIRDDLPKIRAIVDIAERVLDTMSVY